jgi:hypothetical protein
MGPALVSAETDAATLLTPVFAEGGYKPFGELTAADVAARATELKEATGWGPTAKIATVARAWADLARQMNDAGAATVGDLGTDVAAGLAEGLWVVPPGGSLL